jgi:hypothetical protein
MAGGDRAIMTQRSPYLSISLTRENFTNQGAGIRYGSTPALHRVDQGLAEAIGSTGAVGRGRVYKAWDACHIQTGQGGRAAGDTADQRHHMKKRAANPTEQKCPACNGTGFAVAEQPTQPSRRIYPPPCRKCGGKGRIKQAD